MSQYNFTLEANEISLFNGDAYGDVASDNVLTHAQVSAMISENTYKIVHDAPGAVDTMIEISTFFSNTDSDALSTITYEYTDNKTVYSTINANISNSISTNDATISANLVSSSHDVSTEYSRSILENQTQSDAVVTELASVLTADDTFSTAQDNADSTNTYERNTESTSRYNLYTNTISPEVTAYSTAVYNDVVLDNTATHSNQELMLSTELFRASYREGEISTQMYNNDDNQTNSHSSVSTNLSTVRNTTSLVLSSVSGALSTEIVTKTIASNLLASEIQSNSETLSTGIDNLTTQNTNHQTNIYTRHNNLYNAFTVTIPDSRNTYSAAMSSSQYGEDSNITYNSEALSTEFSSNQFINESDALMRVIASGDAIHGHTQIDGKLYLGPYWRISENDDHLGISFEFYDTSSDTWKVMLPFVAPSGTN